MEEDICYRPIGKLHSPHKSAKGTPIQPSSAEGVEGRVEIFPDYRVGLEDLGGFSYVTLIYHFHQNLPRKPSSTQMRPALK
ncbi:SAM-dependent methyltransferase [Candidatus Bipolaricaulota bacterium]|nr:SAM-dependent methyltransferase [Candidatus Bipolaricaulota bacterium]